MARKVTLYHQPDCPACRAAMEYLQQRGIPFTARNVQEDPAALRELILMRRTSTPVLVIDDALLEGFDADQIEAALRATDEGRG